MSEALQDGVDFILDGLAAALELERELGTRAVEIDRSLLLPPTTHAASAPVQAKPVAPPATPQPAPVAAPVAPVARQAAPQSAPAASGQYDFVFRRFPRRRSSFRLARGRSECSSRDLGGRQATG